MSKEYKSRKGFVNREAQVNMGPMQPEPGKAEHTSKILDLVQQSSPLVDIDAARSFAAHLKDFGVHVEVEKKVDRKRIHIFIPKLNTAFLLKTNSSATYYESVAAKFRQRGFKVVVVNAQYFRDNVDRFVIACLDECGVAV